MSTNNLSDDLIITTASILADGMGLDNLTLKLLAETLNVKTPSLYNHIANIDELKERLMHYGWEQVENRMTTSAVGVSGYQALRNMCYAFYDYTTHHPGIFTAMLWCNKYQTTNSTATRIYDLLSRIVQTLGLNEENTIHAVRMLRSFLEGYSLLVVNQTFGNTPPAQTSFEISLNIIIGGISGLENYTQNLQTGTDAVASQDNDFATQQPFEATEASRQAIEEMAAAVMAESFEIPEEVENADDIDDDTDDADDDFDDLGDYQLYDE